jgi:hypothetical protein
MDPPPSEELVGLTSRGDPAMDQWVQAEIEREADGVEDSRELALMRAETQPDAYAKPARVTSSYRREEIRGVPAQPESTPDVECVEVGGDQPLDSRRRSSRVGILSKCLQRDLFKRMTEASMMLGAWGNRESLKGCAAVLVV